MTQLVGLVLQVHYTFSSSIIIKNAPLTERCTPCENQYLWAILDEVTLLKAQMTEVVCRWNTLRQSLLPHLFQLQYQTQNFVYVIAHLHMNQTS